jgi:heme A synthase
MRWVAFAGVVVLLGGFGEFHREMMAQNKVIAAGQMTKAEIRLPERGTPVALAGLGVALAVALSGLFTRGGTLRLLGTLALAAVMIQGLFGGVRVLMNELIGPDLAMIHGMFAQVVFGLLTAITVLSARRDDSESHPRPFGLWPVALASLVFVQVVFGALVRHDPNPLTQRLHMFTAFVAGIAVLWYVRCLVVTSATRVRVRPLAVLLGVLVVLQIYFGVEAWLARFGTQVQTEAERMTLLYIVTRTIHALIGSSLWGLSLALALRLCKPSPAPSHTLVTEFTSPVFAGAKVD